jgi:hypothetical protein
MAVLVCEEVILECLDSQPDSMADRDPTEKGLGLQNRIAFLCHAAYCLLIRTAFLCHADTQSMCFSGFPSACASCDGGATLGELGH